MIGLAIGLTACQSDPITAMSDKEKHNFLLYLLTNRLAEIDQEMRQVDRERIRIRQRTEATKAEGDLVKTMRLLSRSIDLFERSSHLQYERELILEGNHDRIEEYYTKSK